MIVLAMQLIKTYYAKHNKSISYDALRAQKLYTSPQRTLVVLDIVLKLIKSTFSSNKMPFQKIIENINAVPQQLIEHNIVLLDKSSNHYNHLQHNKNDAITLEKAIQRSKKLKLEKEMINEGISIPRRCATEMRLLAYSNPISGLIYFWNNIDHWMSVTLTHRAVDIQRCQMDLFAADHWARRILHLFQADKAYNSISEPACLAGRERKILTIWQNRAAIAIESLDVIIDDLPQLAYLHDNLVKLKTMCQEGRKYHIQPPHLVVAYYMCTQSSNTPYQNI